MSLRIWLPLNNSYENRGTSGATVTTGGVFETPGKLSTYCWRSSARISVPYTYGSTERLSVCMWVKPNSAGAWTSIFGWGNTSTRQNRIEVNANAGTTYYFFGSNDCLVNSNLIVAENFTNAVWHHFAMVADGTKVRFYLDGTLTVTANQRSQVSATFDGNNIFYFGGMNDTFNGYYNDVRVYDHALSQKEVSELAKGMMLHIPMYAGYTGVGTNIAKNTNNIPTAYTIDHSATIIQYDTSFYGLQAEDQYTFSAKLTAPAGKSVAVYVTYFGRIDSSSSHTYYVGIGNTIPAGTTGYSSLTATLHEEILNSYDQIELHVAATDVTVAADETCYVSEVKLEKGSTRTPWIPDASSSQYNSGCAMKDCSGYQVPVGITGNVTTVSGDSPRYGVSGSINGSTGCLWPIPDPITSSTQEFTISVWFKTTKVSDNQCIWNGRTTTGKAVAIFLIGAKIRVDDSAQTTSTTVSVNTWYHLAVTWKSGGKKIIYLNGEQKTSVNAGTLSKSNTKASIGHSSSNDTLDYSNYFSGQMSDFRIYATALTADQVKELYNAPISVANTGACLSEQFTEGASGISFAKTGVVSCNGISSLPGKYDPEVLIEPDGSCWAHIGHHADPTTYKFASGDPFATGVWKDDLRFLDPSFCDNVDKWEFMVIQKADSSASVKKYRWVQTVNPNTAVYEDVPSSAVTKNTGTGYTTFSTGGIYKFNSSAYYVTNNGSKGNWWGAIGAWDAHQGGIPGWAGTVVKDGGFLDLYIRIDNVTFTSSRTGCSLDKGGKGVLSPEFVEQ